MNSEATLISKAAVAFHGSPADFDAVLKRAEGKQVVLLGEASHGTHEFYRIRAEITKRLIREQGFNAVAVEADWPDAHRINTYVRGTGLDSDAVEALGGFLRFPQWMWRNTDVLDFIGWLRNWNDSLSDQERKGMPGSGTAVGFYGLDLYSLNASRKAVIESLEKIDPAAARRVAAHYACFDHYDSDTHRYGLLAGSGVTEDCKKQVQAVMVELHGRRDAYIGRDGAKAADEFFDADQNARLVHDAEEYYRTMIRHDVSSWNLRDRHMMQTLLQLIHHLKETYMHSNVVVWAHNSHLGDASATSMGARGEFNIGQLVREHYGEKALSVGFTTHHGTVTASSDWDGPAERKRVRPSLPGSYEELFHETGLGNFWLDCHADAEVAAVLRQPRLERAIGVIYRPDTERQSHYFHSSLPDQFDGIIHYDATRAVEPLERTVEWSVGETDETYPSGL
jgi:erythromycin esterase-like protein